MEVWFHDCIVRVALRTRFVSANILALPEKANGHIALSLVPFAMSAYDPEIAPDPASWLAIPEQERMRVVRNFHVTSRIKLHSVKGHAAMHALVENQIATGYGPSKRAIARLQEEGLSRHDAVHAIGSVVAELYFETAKDQQIGGSNEFQLRMNEAIEALSAAQWKGKHGS